MKFILAREEAGGICQNAQTYKNPISSSQMGQAGSFYGA